MEKVHPEGENGEMSLLINIWIYIVNEVTSNHIGIYI